MLTHRQQPKDSSTCGQHCVAILCGIMPSTAIVKVGHQRGTYHKELTPVFRMYGWIAQSDKLIKIKKDTIIPETCLMKMWFSKKSHTHWMIKHKDLLYDPGFKNPVEWDDVKHVIAPNRKATEPRITSYLELIKE